MADLAAQASDLIQRLGMVQVKLDPEHRRQLIGQLEAKSSHPDFWADGEEAKSTLKRLSALRQEDDQISQLAKDIEDAAGLVSLMGESPELEKDIARLSRKLEKLEIATFLNGPHDYSNAIVNIHAGQGGTEAMDWTAMLLRMYLRFCESRGFDTEVIEQTPGEEAGFKSVTFTVTGPYAYGYLSGERGTHRLVRQSPFNADALRQTSFALVEVLPQLPENDPKLDIPEKELEFEAFRATGHGGQNVNKVSTAVRLRHTPTGLVVQCQTQRYQEQNRKIALALLKSKLWALREEQLAAEARQLKGAHVAASWGTQIRSYVLHPYRMVKDLRTQVETSQAEAVLDGDLDQFIEAEVRLLHTT